MDILILLPLPLLILHISLLLLLMAPRILALPAIWVRLLLLGRLLLLTFQQIEEMGMRNGPLLTTRRSRAHRHRQKCPLQ
jgi:hypothetical protein